MEESFQSEIAKIPKEIEYHGVWWNDGTWRDFRRGNKIMPFDPVYGARAGKASALIHNRSATEQYLYVVDSDGYVTNNIGSEPSLTRLKKAKAQGEKVVFIFGGSTMFGTGSRTPEDNISSFLETHLNELDQDNYIVINAGVGGWATDNQIRYLMYEVIHLHPDIVIFL